MARSCRYSAIEADAIKAGKVMQSNIQIHPRALKMPPCSAPLQMMPPKAASMTPCCIQIVHFDETDKPAKPGGAASSFSSPIADTTSLRLFVARVPSVTAMMASSCYPFSILDAHLGLPSQTGKKDLPAAGQGLEGGMRNSDGHIRPPFRAAPGGDARRKTEFSACRDIWRRCDGPA